MTDESLNLRMLLALAKSERDRDLLRRCWQRAWERGRRERQAEVERALEALGVNMKGVAMTDIQMKKGVTYRRCDGGAFTQLTGKEGNLWFGSDGFARYDNGVRPSDRTRDFDAVEVIYDPDADPPILRDMTAEDLRTASAALLMAADTLKRGHQCPTHKKAALAQLAIAEERIAAVREAHDGGDDYAVDH